MVFIGLILGAIPPVPLMKKYGSKFVMIVAAIVKIASWLLVGFAHEYWVLLLGRFMAGVGASLNAFTVPIYMGETADKTVRGPIGGLFATSLALGIISFYIAGVWLDRLTVSLVTVWVPLLFLFCCFWIPNSPVYLIKKNRITEARSVLNSLVREMSTSE